MNTALCFSGLVRSIKYTHENLKEFINRNFENYVIFAYLPKGLDAELFPELFPDAIVQIENDPRLFKTKFKNIQFKSAAHVHGSRRKAKFAHMQQLRGIYMSNKMKSEYEEEKNLVFDWAFRLRTDLFFYDNDLNLNELNNDYFYTTNFHNWGGLNDRFLLSSSKNMDIYSNLFNHVKENRVTGWNAESISKNYLDLKNIEVKELDYIKFNRIYSDGSETQDF